MSAGVTTYYYLVLFLLVNFIALAQPVQQKIGLSIGIQKLSQQDFLLSPFSQSGSVFPIRLHFERISDKSLFKTNLTYYSGSLRSTVGNRYLIAQGTLVCSYARLIFTGSKSTKLYLGAGIQNTGMSDTQIINTTTQVSGFLMSNLFLYGHFTHQLNKGNLFLDYYQLLASYSVRPGYNLSPPKNVNSNIASPLDILALGEWASVDKTNFCSVSISYNGYVSKKSSYGVTLEFNYHHIQLPLFNQRVTSVTNGVYFSYYFLL